VHLAQPAAPVGGVRVSPAGLALGGGGVGRLGVGADLRRILDMLAWAMRRRQVRYSPESTCVNGGQDLAAVFERAG